MNFVVFAGGVGGAKLSHGMARSVGAELLTVIVNTADDLEMHGLHVSPDLDTVMYTLGGIANPETGWGIAGDTFNNFDMLQKLGTQPWFRLGDRDLAVHMTRTQLIKDGRTLSEAVAFLSQRLGIQSRILPMTNDRVRTIVDTDEGLFSFQEYFVKARWQPQVRSLIYEGAEEAEALPQAVRAIEIADTIVIAPSNLYLSIDPIAAECVRADHRRHPHHRRRGRQGTGRQAHARTRRGAVRNGRCRALRRLHQRIRAG
jgi:LPPG:FO 2-phospho-L-lactate transferase